MTSLGPILYSFFEDHLKIQKGLRQASIKSYRDVMILFLNFIVQTTHCKISRLRLTDLTCERTISFLKYLEKQRGNQIATRNQRLAALHTFFEYAAGRVPEILIEAERVAAIPFKRTPPPETYFLERDEIQTLFASLPTAGRSALRNRTLLLFLYNTGARVQEVAELRIDNLELEPPARVRLHGKGDKWRVCPLWAETASLLKNLLKERGATTTPQQPVFTSPQGRALTRFGIYKIIRRLTQSLDKKKNNGKRMVISPHVLRHTTAVHLLEAGVEVNVIRSWLGHVCLDTTNRYAEINLHAKEKALQLCEPPVTSSEASPRKPVWRDDKELLKWLEEL
jgi:site-specific recombinase XerD